MHRARSHCRWTRVVVAIVRCSRLGRRLRGPRHERTAGMAVTMGWSTTLSWVFAEVAAVTSGMPAASERMWTLEPHLGRGGGQFVVEPERGAVHRAPVLRARRHRRPQLPRAGVDDPSLHHLAQQTCRGRAFTRDRRQGKHSLIRHWQVPQRGHPHLAADPRCEEPCSSQHPRVSTSRALTARGRGSGSVRAPTEGTTPRPLRRHARWLDTGPRWCFLGEPSTDEVDHHICRRRQCSTQSSSSTTV